MDGKKRNWRARRYGKKAQIAPIWKRHPVFGLQRRMCNSKCRQTIVRWMARLAFLMIREQILKGPGERRSSAIVDGRQELCTTFFSDQLSGLQLSRHQSGDVAGHFMQKSEQFRRLRIRVFAAAHQTGHHAPLYSYRRPSSSWMSTSIIAF